jgi:hypothetical protein
MSSTSPSTDRDRQRLRELRRGLLRLHKTLLDAERAAYEQLHGQVSNHRMLQLVIGDEWFSWLHPMSQLVVKIDDALKAEEPLTAIEADRLTNEARTLLNLPAMGSRYEQQYQNALQREPDVVVAHAAMSQLLKDDTQR